MSWAPVLVGGDRRMYIGPEGDFVELPQEAERFTAREDAVQRAIEARDGERSRQHDAEWILSVDAEEID